VSRREASQIDDVRGGRKKNERRKPFSNRTREARKLGVEPKDHRGGKKKKSKEKKKKVKCMEKRKGRRNPKTVSRRSREDALKWDVLHS